MACCSPVHGLLQIGWMCALGGVVSLPGYEAQVIIPGDNADCNLEDERIQSDLVGVPEVPDRNRCSNQC
jgi:hypothetical protein